MTRLHQSQLTLGAGEGEGVGGRDRRPHAVQHGGGVAARAVSPQANLGREFMNQFLNSDV